MKKENCTYEEMLEVLIDETPYDFVKDDGEMDSATQSCIGLISVAFQRSSIQVKDDLVDMAIDNQEQEDEDNRRQYGHIDMYGDDKRLPS